MVAEELSRIVQSELVELRQRNVAETTTRVRLENQLGDLKVCYTVYIAIAKSLSIHLPYFKYSAVLTLAS